MSMGLQRCRQRHLPSHLFTAFSRTSDKVKPFHGHGLTSDERARRGAMDASSNAGIGTHRLKPSNNSSGPEVNVRAGGDANGHGGRNLNADEQTLG
jgi:hypothetical protein